MLELPRRAPLELPPRIGALILPGAHELPAWRIPRRRPLELPRPRIVQEAAVVVVQKPGDIVSGDPINVSFAAPTTPGNVVFALRAFQNAGGGLQTSGPTVTTIGSQQPCRPTQTYVLIGYRKVQSGDGQTYGFDNTSNLGVRLMEIAGLDPGGVPANVIVAAQIASATIAVPLAGPESHYGFAAIVTRLETPSNSNLAVNAATTAIASGADFMHPANSIGGSMMIYGEGNATLGGTQSGTTRDGFNYAYVGWTWAPPALGFLGEPGGGRW